MNEKRILAVILVFALVFRIANALIFPIFEKPDEEPHFNYINFVAENNKLPVQGKFYAEYFQPPFYNVAASFILRIVKSFTQDIANQVIAMRFLSIIVSMFTLYFIYKIASRLFKEKNLVLGIVAFAAFLPSYVNLNSTVTNSNMDYFLTTVIIYLGIDILEKGVSISRVLLLGIVAGIGLLNRTTVISMLATIPFVLIAAYYPNIKKKLE